jgi:MFS family permease
VLAVTTVTQVLGTMASMALAAVAPRAAVDLGVSPALIGYQLGTVFCGTMLSALLGGGLVRRLGAARTVQLGLSLVAAGGGISALATLPALALGALVVGLGYGVVNPAASHLLSRAPSVRNMNLIFSIKQCGVPIGGALAGLLVPPITLAWGWRSALIGCALLAAAWSLVAASRRRAWDTDRDPAAPVLTSPMESLRTIWRSSALRWITAAGGLYAAVQLCLTGFLVTYLVSDIGLDLLLAGSVLAITNGAGAAGRVGWGWVADRLRSGTKTMIVIGLIAIGGSLATAAFAADWPAWLIGAIAALFGFSVMGWNGVFFAMVVRLSPPQAVGSATGGAIFWSSAAVAIAPAAFAALHDHAGLTYSGGYAMLAFFLAAGIACLAAARRSRVT